MFEDARIAARLLAGLQRIRARGKRIGPSGKDFPDDSQALILPTASDPPDVDAPNTLGGVDVTAIEESATIERDEQPTSFSTGFAGKPVNDAGSATSERARRAPLHVGRMFDTRYRIARLLGVGGMGAVYEAWDRTLGVTVALKVIRREMTADSTVAPEIERRFKRELLLARQVTHQNIVRIHDLGEIDGITYITMAYVTGTDLAAILRREGKLSVARTLRIARTVLSGLVAAHTAGIVHRDLKPANIMVQANDEALIMDFGLARAIDEPVTGDALRGSNGPPNFRPPLPAYTDRTAIGSIVGTVEYMAPEQARGLPADHRADVYAFGLILYDMLAGRRRVNAIGNAADELQTRMNQRPPAVKSIVPEVPDALDRIVSRCIEPDARSRFQTTRDLAAAIEGLDENGESIPIKRLFGTRVLAAVVLIAMTLVAGSWWYARNEIPAAPHDPVSVLIADFQNDTGDPSFDRTLEPMLKLALEGAGFVTAYDRNAIRRSLGVRPPDRLHEQAAQAFAVEQSLDVVLDGALEKQASRYRISIRAAHVVSGNVIASVVDWASGDEQVLGVATKLAISIRKALGDRMSDADQQVDMEALSAIPLAVMRDYGAAVQAMSDARFADAVETLSKLANREPRFGLAYAAMAMASANLDRRQDAQHYVQDALRHPEGMTLRERYRTRGLSYYLTNDYQQCASAYGDMIVRYPADTSARNNLALCMTQLRDYAGAVDQMKRVVAMVPGRQLYRENLAIYAAYVGGWQTAEQEARKLRPPTAFGLLALAFAELAQGRLPESTQTYQDLGKISALGASYAASGLADLALYEGHFADAARLFELSAAEDVARRNLDRAARKFAGLAYAQSLRREDAAATTALEKALASSQAVNVRFLAARILVELGDTAKARALAEGLSSRVQAEAQAYAKIIDADVALKTGNSGQAIQSLTKANALLDSWIGHFDLGRAYLDAGAFIEANSEFDRCIKRRGEALALFLDEEPTFGYFPPVHYYQGRAREGLKSAAFAESYRTYLAIRGRSNEDPFVPDARRRVGG